MKKTVMLVFGTRPEAIKMAPLVKAFQADPDHFRLVVCVTGQHREMLDQVLRLFEIVPDVDLGIMKKGQDLFDVTTRILSGMRDVFTRSAPDAVLVHGDTTSSMAAALAAFYRQIPVGHVEAGLRTRDPYNPWPEEMNRQITGRIASFHFAPTERARRNLLQENVAEEKIFVTGNTVIDAMRLVSDRMTRSPELRVRLAASLKQTGYDPARLEDGRKLVLITGHRRENFGGGFRSICSAVKALNRKYPDADFVYPMHPNPNVREAISEVFGAEPPENMFFIEPLDYLPFVFLMKKCRLVLTDSGGIQEEAPGLGKPVLVMRDTTERPEAVEAGTVKLVGTDFGRITDGVSRLMEDEELYRTMSHAVNPYGDGMACSRILAALR